MQDEFDVQNDYHEAEKPDLDGLDPQVAGLGKNQKIALAVLGFFAFFMLIISTLNFSNKISGPFKVDLSETTDTSDISADDITEYFAQDDSEESLREKDTDHDGLSDWDELNVYNTSPYIEDSDSDGFGDKKEIDSGNDPNCPTGRDCYGEGGAVSEDSSLILEDGSDDVLGDIMADDLDVSYLRDMLRNAGMDEDSLNQLSDEDLISTYNEVLQSSAIE